MSEMPDIHQILTQYWGYSSFREKQEEIIQAALAGKDTLALLPTGGGKSICFQVPGLAQEGLCLVISPLIALMQDQVSQLQKREIKALAINSGMSKREIDIGLDNAAYGDYKFLYVSPERLETELFQARLAKMNVNLIVIDEAHCISQWGYDFRPSYLNIVLLRDLLPKVPMLALTATATPRVIDDIQEKLAFPNKHLIQKSFERKNLAYVVLQEENQEKRMLKVIDGVGGSGIIYVNSRRKTKEIASILLEHRISASFYHAGLSFAERSERQAAWIHNKVQVIVSTNAFGMGIDKPNVRFVIHLDLPESLEAYFQEAGRAGRDEKKAYAVLLNSPAMGSDLKQRIVQSFPEIDTIKTCYLALSNFLQIPINGGENQSFEFDIKAFIKNYNLNANDCYYSLKFLEKEGYISLSDGFSENSKVHIKLGKEDLYKFQVSEPKHDYFIKTLLRTYGGLFDHFVEINETQLAKNLKSDKNKVISSLKRLNELEIIHYEAKSKLPKITYLTQRKEQAALRISKENYHERKKIAFEKLEAVLYYTQSQDRCRSQILLEYFGEKESKRCGICDVCLERNKLELNELEFNEIEKLLKEILVDKPLLLSQIMQQIKRHKEEKVIKVMDFLLENGKLKVKENKYWFK